MRGKDIVVRSGVVLALVAGAAMLPGQAGAARGTPDVSRLIWQVKEALEKNPRTLGCDGSACDHDIAGMFVLPGRRPAAIVLGRTSHGPCMTCETSMSFFRYVLRGGRWKLVKADLAFMSTQGGGGRWRLLHRGRKGSLLVFRQFDGNQGYEAETLSIYALHGKGVRRAGWLCGGRSNRKAREMGGGGRLVDWKARLRVGKGGALRLEVVDAAAHRRSSLPLDIREGKLLAPESLEPRLRLEKCGW